MNTKIASTIRDDRSFDEIAGQSSAGLAYRYLRDGLIWRRWTSGEKLKPQHLTKSCKFTTGALREALIRLAGEGFVTFEEQRGFSTLIPDQKLFYEIRDLRVLLEGEAASLSISNGGPDWEAKLIAAHHRLSHLEAIMVQEECVNDFLRAWSKLDWEFHRALVSACNSETLIEYYRSAYDKSRLYIVAELANFGFRGEQTIAEHKEILDCALQRDNEACIQAIIRHVTVKWDSDLIDTQST